MISKIQNAIEIIRNKYVQLTACLDERSKRIWAATEANSIGWGGISVVCKATGIDHKTIRKGLVEIQGDIHRENNRIRIIGGGRKKLSTINKALLKDLEKLIDPITRGDPESPLLWTCKSTYKLSEALQNQGYQVSQKTIYSMLKELDYSLQSNRKTREGINHPDRDAQFTYIYKRIRYFQSRGNPVISVDTKKKEAVGNYKNAGREYQPQKTPIAVNMHDFPDKKQGKVDPYGVYDVSKNKGWVNVGISSDTAEFAVNTIRYWWHVMGKADYGHCKKLLITADCGGSNGYRVRLWKYELQQLANELSMNIYVCHFPPGTSKWNKIEHRLFSYITQNWRGRPLESKEAIVQLIANTTTKTGLKIGSILDKNTYVKGRKISDKEMLKLCIKHEHFHGEWNYNILPHKN